MIIQKIREKINLWRFNYWNKSVLVTPKISKYVDIFSASNESLILKETYKKYSKMKRAVVQSEISQAHTIALLCKIINAKNVLEIGTFRGYTSAVIASALNEGSKLYTCETNPFFLRDGRVLWKDLKIENKLDWFYGKGLGYLLTFDEGFFDCIFIDADKKDTMLYLENSWSRVKPGGIVIIDNVLWRGLVADHNPIDTRAKALKKINSEIKKEFPDSVIIPAWDGLMIIFKS